VISERALLSRRQWLSLLLSRSLAALHLSIIGESVVFLSPCPRPSSSGSPSISQRIGEEFMGRVAAPYSGPGRIVSFLTAVPSCLSCKQQQQRRHHHHSAAVHRGRRRMSEQGKSGSSTPASGTPAPGSDTYKGWLFKWTNYIKGYQRRWFVLSNGLLSYYR